MAAVTSPRGGDELGKAPPGRGLAKNLAVGNEELVLKTKKIIGARGRDRGVVMTGGSLTLREPQEINMVGSISRSFTLMKVSIVTVCYNSEATIRDTIESVIAQSYPDIEYIIVDGASTDRTMAIVNGYKDRISMVVSEPDKGIYDAMNKGIKLATGDVVGLLNSDDFFADNTIISKLVHTFENDVTVAGIYGDLVYVQKNNASKNVRYYSSRFFSRWKIRFGLMLPHPTLYLRREVFQEFGFYKLDYRVAADYEFITRLITRGVSLKRLPTVMVKMRAGGISSTGIWWCIHQNMEIVRACRDNGVYTNFFMISAKFPFKILSYFRR